MQVVILKQPLYGTVYWNGLDFVYTSNTNVNVNDFFIYAKTINGITTIYEKIINLDNTSPVANNVQLTAYVGSKIEIDVNQLATDVNKPFGELTITSVSGNNYGKLSTDGKKIYYNPEPYNGIEYITYTVSDKLLKSNGLITLNLVGGLSTREIPISGIRRFTVLERKIAQLSYLSAGYSSMYSILTTFSATWENINYDRYNGMSDVVDIGNLTWTSTYRNKPKYDNLITVLCANSADWNSDVPVGSDTYDLINPKIIIWKSNYAVLTAYQPSWNQAITTYEIVSAGLDLIQFKISSTQQTVDDNSLTTWDSTEIAAATANYFPVWNGGSTITFSYSADWNKNINDVVSVSTSYYNEKNYKFDQLIQTVDNNSNSKWNLTNLNSISANYFNKWNDLYTFINTYSAVWNNSITNLSSLSSLYNQIKFNLETLNQTVTNNASSKWNLTNLNTISADYFDKWNYLFTLINSYSAIWNNTITNLNILSASYYTNKVNFDSVTQTVNDNAYTNWDTTTINNLVSSNSPNWDNIYSLLVSYSGIWNDNITNVNLLSNSYYINKVNFDNLTQTVNTSSNWDSSVISNNLSSNSANWNNTYNTLTTYNQSWTNSNTSLSNLSDGYYSNYLDYDNSYTTINTNSGNLWNNTEIASVSSNFSRWINTYNILTAYSGTWNASNSFGNQLVIYNDLYNFVKQNSATLWNSSETFPFNAIGILYNNLYNLVRSNSGIWDTSYYSSVSADFFDKLANYNSLYYTLCTLSGTWGSLSSFPFNIYKDKWNSVYENLFIQNNLDYFNLAVTNYSNFYNVYITNSSVFDNLTNYINSNIIYFDTTTITNVLTSNNTKWNSTYNNVRNLSANWFFTNTSADPLCSYTQNTSASLINLYNNINSNSASYNDAKSVVDNNLTQFLTGSSTISFSANRLDVKKDLTVFNNLSVLGNFNKIDTEVQTTSSFTITNNSTNDALVVTKIGGYGGLATFKNSLSVNVLDINANRTVGINTSAANTDLTVVGNISASGYVYPFLRETINSFTSNSANYFSNYTYVTANSANINTLNNNRSLYDSYVSYLSLSTSTINNILSNDFVRYQNMFNISNSQSGINDQTYNFIILSGSNIDKDFLYRNNKSIYDNLYSVATGLSTGNIGGTYQIFNHFSYTKILNSKTIEVLIPQRVKILEWTVLSDVNTTASFDVLTSTVALYNPSLPARQTLISLSNNPTLTNSTKNKYTGLDSIWPNILQQDSVLILKLTQNTSASAISVNLKVSKI